MTTKIFCAECIGSVLSIKHGCGINFSYKSLTNSDSESNPSIVHDGFRRKRQTDIFGFLIDEECAPRDETMC